MRKVFLSFLFALVVLLFIGTQTTEARSGCCSHHGGVCGCGCCDGSSLSAICAPYYPQCSTIGASTTNNVQVSQAVTGFIPRPTATPTPTITPEPTRTPTRQPTRSAGVGNNALQQPKPQSPSFWTIILKFFHLI